MFINTTDGHERELLPEWLEERGVPARPAALARARELREALRALLIANNEGGSPPASALETIERAADRARLTLRVADEAEIVPLAGGVDAALGAVLAAGFSEMRDGSWSRLKACRNCHWAFYDESRNRSAAWCSMQLCGNRSKIRTYRERHKSLA